MTPRAELPLNTAKVVVVDDGAVHDFERALRSALRTAGGAEVVAVTHRVRRLGPAVRGRVRLVAVRSPREVARAAEAELADGTATVLRRVAELRGRGGGQAPVPLVRRVPDATGRPAPVAFRAAPSARAALAVRTASATSVSAVLIVKDEEKVLGECLAALSGAVDEVVVYDTGSSDATVSIAEAHDAVVVHGHWNDHFGDARNRALAHATGEWVLSVDADEVLRGDVAVLRRRLSVETADVLLLPIVNTTWEGAEGGHRFQPPRLFRRARCRWTGALHEHLVPADGQAPLVLSEHVPAVHLDHSGYQLLTFADKDKSSRNLAISRAAVERLAQTGEDATTAWDGYGRSLLSAGHHREALDALQHVLDNPTKRSAVVLSGRAAVACMVALDDMTRLDDWLRVMDDNGEAVAFGLVWRARSAVARGELSLADQLLAEAEADRSVDCWGVPHPASDLVTARSTLRLARGDAPGALGLLVEHIASAPDAISLADLHAVAARARADLTELVARLPLAFCQRSAQEAVVMCAEDADGWLSALHAHHPGEPVVLAAGSVVAQRGTLERALTWSTRVRSVGAPELCPLRAVGEQEDRPLTERALALAVLADVVDDGPALARLVEVLSAAAEQDVDAALAALQSSVPGAVERLLQDVPA